jgi:hypothetical protein
MPGAKSFVEKSAIPKKIVCHLLKLLLYLDMPIHEILVGLDGGRQFGHKPIKVFYINDLKGKQTIISCFEEAQNSTPFSDKSSSITILLINLVYRTTDISIFGQFVAKGRYY